jgi:hypothetical protein
MDEKYIVLVPNMEEAVHYEDLSLNVRVILK